MKIVNNTGIEKGQSLKEIEGKLCSVMKYIYKALSAREYTKLQWILSPLQRLCACFCVKPLLICTMSL